MLHIRGFINMSLASYEQCLREYYEGQWLDLPYAWNGKNSFHKACATGTYSRLGGDSVEVRKTAEPCPIAYPLGIMVNI